MQVNVHVERWMIDASESGEEVIERAINEAILAATVSAASPALYTVVARGQDYALIALGGLRVDARVDLPDEALLVVALYNLGGPVHPTEFTIEVSELAADPAVCDAEDDGTAPGVECDDQPIISPNPLRES